MRVKKKLHLAEVEGIKGLTSLGLIEKCPDQRSVFPFRPCKNGGCEFAIKQPGYMNCCFVASETGEHTLEAIGEMMGLTREGIRVIEFRAMRKFRQRWKEGNSDEPPIRQQDVASGSS